MAEPSENTVFISFSHRQAAWMRRLLTHLTLPPGYAVDPWVDERLKTGDRWMEELLRALSSARVAILLISADFLASKFITVEEVPRFLERRRKEGLHILPVRVSHCHLEPHPWLKELQLYPPDGKPIPYWTRARPHASDKCWTELVAELRELLGARMEQSPKARQVWRPLAPRYVSDSRLPTLNKPIYGRERELEALDQAWRTRNTNILTLTAFGGVGKTSLVRHWLNTMKSYGYRGAQRVFCWSFYRQGTSELLNSADEFISEALLWFGDSTPNKGSPWDKGERLARHIQQQRTLLVLDGLEPLQHPQGPFEGKLKDPSLVALVRELAADNPGLCLITSRQRIEDLEEGPGSPVIRLDHLSDVAGAELLDSLGVRGRSEERERASQKLGGHALALTLFATYLRNRAQRNRNIRIALDEQAWEELNLLDQDEAHGGRALRMMEFYERWLGEGEALSILRLVGLFDRPASRELVDVLRHRPVIQGLTTHLMGVSEKKWSEALAYLRSARLLLEKNPQAPDALDAHPLIREYFARELKTHRPEAWRAGHRRIYEYLKSRPRKPPASVNDLAPLYEAIFHGCQARQFQDALDLFYNRVAPHSRKFGAYGADLTALSGFFEKPWTTPTDELSEEGTAYVFANVGYCLRALGRLTEAIRPMEAGLQRARRLAESAGEQPPAKRLEYLRNVSQGAMNLSELHLLLGDIAQAEEYARLGMEFADRSDDVNYQIRATASLANALVQGGDVSEARKLFTKAEALQRAASEAHPLLYGIPGFHYCSLLLDEGRCQELLSERAVTLSWVPADESLWMAVTHLWLGQAHFRQARQEGSRDFSQALYQLQQSIQRFRDARSLYYFPCALLARASVRRAQGDYVEAQQDLDEALSLAESSGMRLYQLDLGLEHVRLLLDQDQAELAQEQLVSLRALLQETGYARRALDVAKLEAQLEPTRH